MISLLIVINIILAAVSAVFVIKNLLVKYTWSKKTAKNVLMIAGVLISLFISFACLNSGFAISESRSQLQYDLTKAEGIFDGDIPKSEIIKDKIKDLDKIVYEIEIYTAIGWLSFISTFILHKNIVKEIDEIKPEGKWNL